jgi:TatD DNase family protein
MELKKPVIVHCVKAFDVLSSIIKKYQNQTIFIIHGFNQNEQIALQLLKLGVYLSFGNALLNVKNERLRNIFAETPNHQLFIENDDSVCQLEQIYDAAAVIKKCELDVMKEIIFANYKKVFTHE